MAKTMLWNPYTGMPRHPSDIASDPAGLLMLDPDEPLLAARSRESMATVEDLLKALQTISADAYLPNSKAAWEAAESFRAAVLKQLVASAVERINRTNIIESESMEKLRMVIAQRVSDMGKSTFVF